jgi:hypothetical protein
MIKTVKILKKNIKNKKKSVRENVKKEKLTDFKPLKTFNTLKFNISNLPHKNAAFVQQLQLRHLYNLTLQRRLFILNLKGKTKKNYKFFRNFVQRKQKSFKRLLQIYSRNFARFVRKRKKVKKYFKRLLRRHKRKKKWRRRGVFKLFRSRYCFKHKFYIPRHFEINYKTGNMLYLGYNDPATYNFRLPFSLNIRKLSTWLSS